MKNNIDPNSIPKNTVIIEIPNVIPTPLRKVLKYSPKNPKSNTFCPPSLDIEYNIKIISISYL